VERPASFKGLCGDFPLTAKPPSSHSTDWNGKRASIREALLRQLIENTFGLRHIGGMEDSLEHMARTLADSGDYRILRRLASQTEYHSADNIPNLVAAIVDVETTGTNPDRDKIIELGICLFEYDRHGGRIYKVLGSWEWFEDPGATIPRRSPISLESLMKWSPVTASTIEPLTIYWGGSFSSSPTTPLLIVASWRGGFPSSPLSIGRAAVPISIGKLRAFAHRRSNSSPTPWDFSMTGIEPRVIVWPHSMYWPDRSPERGGSHYKLFWKKHDLRHGGFGQGTVPSRQKICSRTGVTPGAQESSHDRGVGIATCRMPIRRRRSRGYDQT